MQKPKNLVSIEKDLKRVVNMFWDIEKRHWEETPDNDNHVLHSLNNIKNWLESLRRNNEQY